MQKKLFIEKLSPQAIVILLLASGFYFYEFIMQGAPVTIAQELMHDFAIDATGLGIISACFYYSYTPLQLTTGLLLDRYSTRIILTCVCTIFASGTLLFANAETTYSAAIARLIMGGAAACAFIGVLHLIIRWVPPTYFALFAGIVEMMGAIGGGVGSAPLALLLKHFDWRTAIKNLAYAGFALALLIALLVRNQPTNTKIIRPAKLPKNFIWNNLKTLLQNKETWAIGSYSFLIWAQVLGFTTLWGAPFLRLSCNLDNVAATHAIAYVWIGIALASPIIGWLSDFIQRRKIIMSTCAIAGTIAMSIIIFVTAIPPGILYCLMFTIGFASAGQTLAFALIKDINPSHIIGTANGFNNMCVVAGGLLFPIIIGKILDFNWQGIIENNVRIYTLSNYQMALTLLPLCYFLATIICIFWIKETNCRDVWTHHNNHS